VPTFATPEPISATVDLVVGDVRITAGDRAETVVEVRPGDPTRDADTRAAAATRVEYAAGTLLVKGPKRRLGVFGGIGSIDVTIELPAGSQLLGTASVAGFQCTGRLAACRIRTGAGDLRVDQTGPVDLHTSAGAIVLDRATGHADVSTGTGAVRVGAVDGTAVVKNSNGAIWIGEVTGDLRANAANGEIRVDRAAASVVASSANGAIQLAEISQGAVTAKTALGGIEIGIRAGTAARLDVATHFGQVRNQLEPADPPGPADRTAEVQARTSYGDIVIRRCPDTGRTEPEQP